ncbi:MAG TPA: hypothetical protein VJR89_37080 [Polyangiales bacterium]|nr:hypothetical protein [Polyangiales bacterium]
MGFLDLVIVAALRNGNKAVFVIDVVDQPGPFSFCCIAEMRASESIQRA